MIKKIVTITSLVKELQRCPITGEHTNLSKTPCCKQVIDEQFLNRLRLQPEKTSEKGRKIKPCCPFCKKTSYKIETKEGITQQKFGINNEEAIKIILASSETAQQYFATIPKRDAALYFEHLLAGYSNPEKLDNTTHNLVISLEYSTNTLAKLTRKNVSWYANYAAKVQFNRFMDELPDKVIQTHFDDLFRSFQTQLSEDSPMVWSIIVETTRQKIRKVLQEDLKPRIQESFINQMRVKIENILRELKPNIFYFLTIE